MKKMILFMIVITAVGLIIAIAKSSSVVEKQSLTAKQIDSIVSSGAANPKAPHDQSPNIGGLIVVPSGSFQRDSINSNISSVSAFYMSKYEITRAQFTAIAELPDPSDDSIAASQNNSPAQNITWYHALVFCNRLSMKEGLTPVYAIAGNTDPLKWGTVPVTDNVVWNQATANWNANGYRLPTEAEWLWAAMGADTASPRQVNTTGINKLFAGDAAGQTLSAYGWYSGNSEGTAHLVGMKHANELGFYDLTGNVWEWCWDLYGRLPSGEIRDYRGSVVGTDRVLHGGSWRNETDRINLAFRLNHYPSYKYPNIGFRVVRQ